MTTEQFQVMQMMRKSLSYLTLMIALLCAGCANQTLPPAKVATSTPGIPWAIWQGEIATFTDPTLGFQVNVPNNWSILPSENRNTQTGARIVYFYSPCYEKSPDVIPPCTKIEVLVYKTNVSDINEIKKLQQEADAQGNPEKVIVERYDLDLNSIPAIWTLSNAPEWPDIIEVLLLTNERAIAIRAYGELQPVKEIIESIEPVGP